MGRGGSAPHPRGGGGPGARGHNYVVRAEGAQDELKGNDETELRSGDLFVLETPGGGGFGSPVEDQAADGEIAE